MEKSVLDLLLQTDIPQPQTKEYEVKRLSEICGQPIIFKLKQLSYSRVSEIKNLQEDADAMTVFTGTVEPSFKNKELMEKYGAATPLDVIKKMLLPGEATAIAVEIERLSGFRTKVLEEVKKN